MIKAIVQQDSSPVLRQVSKEVPTEWFNTTKLNNILQDLSDTLDAAHDGVAIAAPQIGEGYRIFVVSKKVFEWPETDQPFNPEFINPIIVKRSRKTKMMDEGCLSVRHWFGKTKRSEKVTVEAYNASGEKFNYHGEGLLAQIFQHEIDHLNGILFNDHATHLHYDEDSANSR
jgi:peptide deformylase